MEQDGDLYLQLRDHLDLLQLQRLSGRTAQQRTDEQRAIAQWLFQQCGLDISEQFIVVDMSDDKAYTAMERLTSLPNQLEAHRRRSGSAAARARRRYGPPHRCHLTAKRGPH